MTAVSIRVSASRRETSARVEQAPANISLRGRSAACLTVAGTLESSKVVEESVERISPCDTAFTFPPAVETATPEALETLVRRGESLGFSSVMIADHVVFPVTINSKYPYTVTGAFRGRETPSSSSPSWPSSRAETRTLRLVSSVHDRAPPESGGHREDARDHRRAVARAGHRGRRGGLASRGIPGARRARLRSSGQRERRVHPHHEDALDRMPRLVRRANSIASRPSGACPRRCRSRIRRSGSAVTARLRCAGWRAWADGWHPVGANPAVPLRPPELAALLDELRRLTEAEGRDPSRLTISYKAPSMIRVQPLDGRTGSGGFLRLARGDRGRHRRLCPARGEQVIFDFRSERLAESLERMERFAPVMRSTARV